MANVVVGAAIIEGGRLFAAQRTEPPELAGGWEFPGGKVDPGETDEQALVRECREELGIEIALGKRIGDDWPLADPAYIMRIWTAKILNGTPQALEHSEIRWLASHELFDVPWLLSDLPVVDALLEYLR